LLRLTGLDVEEYQARRLLNDLDTFRAQLAVPADEEDVIAHRWMTERFEWVTAQVPRHLRGKLEPAQVFHEVLEHQWFMSERASRDVGLKVATDDYVEKVLAAKPDEASVLGARPSSGVDETAELRILMPRDQRP
jgi:DNA-binding transcriptional LysR family regulator